MTSLIPLPMVLLILDGSFILNRQTAILSAKSNQIAADYLAEFLKPAFGFELGVQIVGATEDLSKRVNCIALLGDPSTEGLGKEGYELRVDKDRITVRSNGVAGAFYAGQTLRQLLPVEVESRTSVGDVAWEIPCVEITDKPRFQWRGSLLDCSRHFRTKEFVKEYIDLLALYKMNRFHWHLTDDQGWRLEIKKYPKLTEIGAWREGETGERYGGFYTQDDVREILQYAALRNVMVVPEIEMPGHSTAALACYPELSCTGGPFEVGKVWGVFEDVFCAGNEETFRFIEDVLSETIDLFPSPWIHIGGDECPKVRWRDCPKCQERMREKGFENEDQLQSWFIDRIERFLSGRGRKLVGWDEILEGGLSPYATVQSWRGMEGGTIAALDGHDVIMSPTTHCYLDYSYESISVEKAYSFEPVPTSLPPDGIRHILGIEGNMWGERTQTTDRIHYQAFPRLCALSEVGWSPKESRNFQDFASRLKVHGRRLETLGVAFYRDPEIWPSVDK